MRKKGKGESAENKEVRETGETGKRTSARASEPKEKSGADKRRGKKNGEKEALA